MKLPAVVANFNILIFLSVVEVIISIKGFLGWLVTSKMQSGNKCIHLPVYVHVDLSEERL
jgi:hypothetical protein